uniref:Uncharacterized protein n=1 Tax=Nelumbo nucifera TaxID=4432 RepID=A0A822XUP2_NELNU|nr:TPA_asm: hypothetical protein HUJ06_024926 [Nelumbo nucifera]
MTICFSKNLDHEVALSSIVGKNQALEPKSTGVLTINSE